MQLILLTTLVMVAFAANSVLNRLGLADGAIGPSAFAVIRVVAGTVMLAALSFWRDKKLFDLAEVSLLSAGSLSVYILGFSYAYVSLDAGVGALILFGGVQITMFAGAVISRERLPKSRWIGAVVAFSGLAYLFAPGAVAPNIAGTGLMVTAAIGWGIYSLYGRKVKRPLQATAGNFLLSVPVALVVGSMIWDGTVPQTSGILLAVLSGAVTSGLGYALWYRVLPQLETSVAAVAQLTVPVIALSGGVIFLGEAITLQFVVASALILGGIFISIRK